MILKLKNQKTKQSIFNSWNYTLGLKPDLIEMRVLCHFLGGSKALRAAVMNVCP
jgi:hypothetical protein